MRFFSANICTIARDNSDFRRVVYTGPNSQIVVMTLGSREEIGEEVHEEVDQIFFVLEGAGAATVDGTLVKITSGDVVFVPRGARHNVISTDSGEALKLASIYSPPVHAPGTVHHTRRDAEAEHAAARC